ncbi:4'-phosphopantetheinyl transferase family protein [Niabella ginsengisoli]|uniref:4'-phosphopantetheinyl transferase superfamily protein n=1 Tax=Niabella ginsengisoli TaxID=522298 RepID=A0ABS9SJH3_9BACT|nr:4'-phosphopantetheinyl transferase superfamily protein [Niabella ginsengisoli]MCH5598537.1 4'-phosphopantetheinyl transferase superfamily protein [Niabella ginsengisoli]
MPVFYQQNINETTRLGIWKIEEDESFFKQLIPLHRDVTHPHKRLQHLAGRFLLRYLFADFPSDLIQIADTKKPFLPNEAYHFSVSHCGDYAAAIVSTNNRVGIDIEIPTSKVARIRHKFISNDDELLRPQTIEELTQLWSAKEAVFKWDGNGEVDFKQHIQLKQYKRDRSLMECYFVKRNMLIDIHLEYLPPICLSYIYTPTLL